MKQKKTKKRVKNIALILAGGIGARTRLRTPKQFINVQDKPIIVYTLEHFNRNRQIDDIIVVVLDGWQAAMERYVEEFGLDKVKHIVKGGVTGQESIQIGVELMCGHYQPEDIVIIHDAVRPLIADEVIDSCISCTLLNGNATAVVPSTEALLITSDWSTSTRTIDRNIIMRTQTPQGLRLGKLAWAHQEAKNRGINNSIATCTLLIELGEKVHFVNGMTSNIKITTGDDIDLFAAYLRNESTLR